MIYSACIKQYFLMEKSIILMNVAIENYDYYVHKGK